MGHGAGMAVPDARDLRLAFKPPIAGTTAPVRDLQVADDANGEIYVLDSDANSEEVDLFNRARDRIIVHVSM